MKKVVIASENPVKIKAVQDGFLKVYGFTEEIKVIPRVVDSGVSDQPLSDQETFTGALNRAKAIQQQVPKADYWVGLEGGIDTSYDSVYSFAWIVILSDNSKGLSRTASFALPQKVVSLIQEGKELGDAMDILYHDKNSKQKQGAVGTLTKGVITRSQLYVPSVVLALCQILRD